jgi:hypothetical protein
MHLTLTRYGSTSVMITRTDGSEGMPYTLLKAIESTPGVEAASFQKGSNNMIAVLWSSPRASEDAAAIRESMSRLYDLLEDQGRNELRQFVEHGNKETWLP